MSGILLGLNRPPVAPVATKRTPEHYVAVLKGQTQDTVLLAIAQPGWTPATLEHLHWAECAGHKRPLVLRAIERRRAEIGDEQPTVKPRLVFGGQAMEEGEIAWEKVHEQ